MTKKREEETCLTIEEGMASIEEVLTRMEEREISLEEAFVLYEKGMRLLKMTNERIDAVEKKVLAIAADGGLREFPEE